MSVIGRLDEQVSRVLIEPLAANYKSVGENTAETPSPNLLPAPPATESQTDRSADGRHELPVWLL
ncbi:MAG TPA: hypothetical protein VM943_07560 [Pyrinomonadaceae bacterium]|nr:hypothetical protein [Pyrinomonadaceae bacterium]